MDKPNQSGQIKHHREKPRAGGPFLYQIRWWYRPDRPENQNTVFCSHRHICKVALSQPNARDLYRDLLLAGMGNAPPYSFRIYHPTGKVYAYANEAYFRTLQ